MKYWKLFLFVVVLAGLSSCRSSKTVTTTSGGTIVKGASDTMNQAAKTIVSFANENRSEEEMMTAKTNLTLESGVKKVSVGGNLKMKRDDVIQLSLVAFGFVEAGRIELTKDYLMIVDKIGHQYVKANYKDIPFLKNAGIDFYTFQSLFWDELFLLGDKGVAPSESSYTKTVQDDGIKLVNEDSKLMTLTFLTNAMNGLVRQTTVSGKQANTNTMALDWSYVNYGKLGKKDFPDKMQITLKAGSKPVQATLGLSNIKVADDWETRTDVSKRYTEVSMEAIFNRIMSLTN